jgi:hypothetical protein
MGEVNFCSGHAVRIAAMARIAALLASALAILALAAIASAQAPSPPLNGAYYGAFPGTNTIVAMGIRNNVIGATSVFSMNFGSITNGVPDAFLPGTGFTTLANPGGVNINRSTGSWSLPGVLPEEGLIVPPLCGQSRSSYLVAGFTCAQTGLQPGTKPLFSLRKASLTIPSGSVFSGSVNATPGFPPSASSPSTPWTGPEGSLNLQVMGQGTDTFMVGSATLTPVNPNTGIPTGAPPQTVSYGPVAESSAPLPDQQGGGFSSTTGFFSLPSNPPGYTVCGGILPTGFVFGSISCGENLPYVPATFVLTGESAG